MGMVKLFLLVLLVGGFVELSQWVFAGPVDDHSLNRARLAAVALFVGFCGLAAYAVGEYR